VAQQAAVGRDEGLHPRDDEGREGVARVGGEVEHRAVIGGIETAVEAMKLGAFDYIKKPFDVEELKLIVRKALDYAGLEREVQGLRKEVRGRYSLEQIIGQDKRMQEILSMIETVADAKSTVLICGESGTGKELIARAIHYLSPRAGGPFVKVNCAAISETLLESELFGHEKGAFTGAIRQHEGRFEQANGGTLLLDEISEMSAGVQSKLLRVLQEKEFDRVGGQRPIKVDVRVIATTNRDLEKEQEEGRFREDLFYRLNVVKIESPPLRDRKSDIPLLIEHFSKQFNEEMGKGIGGFSEDAMSLMMNYDWPGNVRQLENAVERGIVFCRGDAVLPEHLPPELGANVVGDAACPGSWIGKRLEDIEKEVILETLKSVDDNRTKAAGILGISVRTLRNKLGAYRESGDI